MYLSIAFLFFILIPPSSSKSYEKNRNKNTQRQDGMDVY